MRHSVIVIVAVFVALTAFVPLAAAGEAGVTVGTADVGSNTAGAVAVDADCSYPVTLVDATGEEIEIDEAPESVVALYPSDAQLAFEIGAEDRVVGMPIGQYTDSLDAGDRTDITEDDGVTPVAEEIIALDPDVVIAANIALFDEALLDQLREAGLTVYVQGGAQSIEDVQENVRLTGQLTGACDGAERTVEWMDERLGLVESAIEDEDRPLAYYTIDDEGTTAGTETFQHEVLVRGGVENVAEAAGIEQWGSISPEVVLEEDPEWILYPDWADEPPIAESLQETTAYQEGNVVAVDDDQMNQPGPNVVFVIDRIVEAVHPDAYAEIEADLDALDEAYESERADALGSTEDDGSADDEGNADDADGASDADGADDTAEASADDSDDSIPGFGIPIAIAAVVGGIGLRFESR